MVQKNICEKKLKGWQNLFQFHNNKQKKVAITKNMYMSIVIIIFFLFLFS